MATKNLLIDFGQSNGTPVANQAEWLALHPELNLQNVAILGRGASSQRFQMPGGFPGFEELDLRGVATRQLRYLTFYNPCATGYKTYPGIGRLALLGAHTTTEIAVEQIFTVGTAPFTITRRRTGTVHTVTAVSTAGLPAGAGCKLTLDGTTPWVTALQTEEFDYTVKVTAGTGTAVLTINLGFGLGFGTALNGQLIGLLLRAETGANAGQSRVIRTFDNTSRQVTLESAFANAIAGGDTFSITPQSGAYEDFAFWLPWCPYEAADEFGKVSPYPPGLNHPNHWSIPQTYLYNATRTSKTWTVFSDVTNTLESIAHGFVTGQSVRLTTTGTLPVGLIAGVEYFLLVTTADRFRFSSTPDGLNVVDFVGAGTGTHSVTFGTGLVPKLMAWHTGVARNLQQLLGGDLYVLTGAVGGISLARSEIGYFQGDVGWFDPTAETCWTPSEPDNCFRRLLRQVSAGITAAAADGDDLVVRALTFPQGEADALLDSASRNYAENLRGMKEALRTELKALGVWPRSAELIPFLHPKIDAGAWPFAGAVNDAIQVVSEEDRASRSLQVDDLTFAGGHLKAASMQTLAQRALDAFVAVRGDTDQAGELAICNKALKLIGDAGQITSIDPSDGSAQADACADLYPLVRDTLLEEHAWGFATKRVALTALVSTTTVWTESYLRPGDVSHVLQVQPPEATSDSIASVYPRDFWTGEPRDRSYAGGEKVPQPYSVEQDPSGRQVIYTNQPDAQLVYVQKVTDTRRFSALFKEAAVLRLAAELALSLVRGDAGARLAKGLRTYAAECVVRAKDADMLESDDPPNDFPKTLAGMH